VKKIIRVQQREQFVVVLSQTVKDDRLSWRARGLLCYLLSLPDDWQINVSYLLNCAPDKETALRNGMRELEAFGYLTKTQTRNEKGRITGTEWIVHERPYGDYPHVEKPHVVNQGLLNIKLNLRTNVPNNDGTQVNQDIGLINNPSIKESDSLSQNESENWAELVEAIERITGLDMKIRTNAGRIVKTAKELRDAGYSAKDVLAFGDKWRRDWRYKANGTPPTLTQLKAEIAIVPKSEEDMALEAFRELSRKQRQGE